MGKIARLIWIEDYVWNEFQKVYPRQASKTIESTMKRIIELHSIIDDKQLEELYYEQDQKKKSIEELQDSIRLVQAKIEVVKAKERDKILLAEREAEKHSTSEDHELDIIQQVISSEDV